MKETYWNSIRVGALVLFGFGSLFLFAETVAVFQSMHYAGTAPSTNTITVTGNGETYVTPDIAEVSFSVSKDASTVATANTEVTTLMTSMINSLKALGIADADIQTSGYDVSPKYNYQAVPCMGGDCSNSNQVLVGYTVSNSVNLKIRNLDNAGTVLTLLGQNGATNVSGLTFTVDNPTTSKDQARAMAITDAETQAKTLAQQLGVHLVAITNFSENANTPVFYNAMASAVAPSMAPAAPVPVQVGQNQVTSDVSITYLIK